jgi:N-acetylglucosaminyldiphosphoundecaprenol N-acetyl-beta-D-mannosaminyltransferase
MEPKSAASTATSTGPATGASALPQVRIGDLDVHRIDEAECVAHTMRELAAGRGGWIATANLDHLRMLRSSAEFRRAYQNATIVVADGMPLVWAARLQGTPLPGRVAGSDLIHSLSRAAAAHGRRIYLLGGNPGAADAAAERLCTAAPGLVVAGTDCPPFGFDRDPALMQALRERVAASGADVVFVALGAPKQELLIGAIRDALPRAFWIGVGISFSFVSGEVRRAPSWMRRVGLEWVHRLWQEPRRLARRYLLHGVPFAARLLLQACWRRVRGARPRPGAPPATGS